jgi:hypothetical protein
MPDGTAGGQIRAISLRQYHLSWVEVLLVAAAMMAMVPQAKIRRPNRSQYRRAQIFCICVALLRLASFLRIARGGA